MDTMCFLPHKPRLNGSFLHIMHEMCTHFEWFQGNRREKEVLS